MGVLFGCDGRTLQKEKCSTGTQVPGFIGFSGHSHIASVRILTDGILYRNRAVENPYRRHSLYKEPSERSLHLAISIEKINGRGLRVSVVSIFNIPAPGGN